MNTPWVTPAEVKGYSEYKQVQERTDERVAVDIARAEQYIRTLTHNDFAEYEEMPAEVKTATILLAEAYGYNAALKANALKSETFDDYSYTAETSAIGLDTLDISALLDAYVVPQPRNGVTMRMRKL